MSQHSLKTILNLNEFYLKKRLKQKISKFLLRTSAKEIKGKRNRITIEKSCALPIPIRVVHNNYNKVQIPGKWQEE